VSAAVRLGKLGPSAAQRVLDRVRPASLPARALDDAATTAPLEELFGMFHDALPARLFQS
jgi:urease accessory protein UreF